MSRKFEKLFRKVYIYYGVQSWTLRKQNRPTIYRNVGSGIFCLVNYIDYKNDM